MSDEQPVWSDYAIRTALWDTHYKRGADAVPVLHGRDAESICRRIRDDLTARLCAVEAELADVLAVAIARGEKLGYVDADDDWRKRYTELTGKDSEADDGSN